MSPPSTRAAGGDYRALVCITTCRRLHRLRRYLPHFAALSVADPRFAVLVSLDGTEEEYLAFCREWRVPLVHSDEREGVGISKNRVLERFPDFDCYFFLDDDVELVDARAFPLQVEVARAGGIHHFSLYERGGTREVTGESMVEGHRVVHGLYGGGQLNFFTREGLEAVGGWHPAFARWRRWGHTEHSHRYPRAGLAPAPFNVVSDLTDAFVWHYPPPVSRVRDVPMDDDQIAEPERALMQEALRHVPVQTLSAHHHNGFAPGPLEQLASTLRDGDRYPLLSGAERRRCQAEFLLWRAGKGGVWPGIRDLLGSAVLWPGNPLLRHRLKHVLGLA